MSQKYEKLSHAYTYCGMCYNYIVQLFQLVLVSSIVKPFQEFKSIWESCKMVSIIFEPCLPHSNDQSWTSPPHVHWKVLDFKHNLKSLLQIWVHSKRCGKLFPLDNLSSKNVELDIMKLLHLFGACPWALAWESLRCTCWSTC